MKSFESFAAHFIQVSGATIDLEHDAADAHGRMICPLTVLWGKRNGIWDRFDMMDAWRPAS